MPANESTMKFRADISNMKAAMQEAGRAIRLANAEFKEAVAGMDDWNKSSDGLTAKLKQLDTTLQAQKRQLAALDAEYKKVVKDQGADSKGAQELAIKISNQRAAVKKTEKAIEDYSEELRKAEDPAEDLGESVEDAGKAAEKSADGFTVMKGALASLIADGIRRAIDALADFAKDSIEAGKAFEASMSNVKALSGATEGEITRLSDKAKELGRTTKFTASEAADAFGYMSLAGWDVNQMLSGIDGVMSLAAASGMDLANASDMITDYLSAFNLEAADASRVADMLAYAQAHANTTAEQLGEAYGNSAAGLNTAGQSIETVTALLEGMANQGTKGSEAGTALNGIMSQITQKMKDGAIQIGETTVAVQDQSGNFRDLIDIIADVDAATEGMGTAEKSAALAAVFNRTSLSGLNQVLNEGVDNIRGYRDELYNATGAAEDMADVMQDNLQGDLTTLDSALEGLGIAAFNYVSGPLRSVVQTVTTIIGSITKLISPQKSVIDDFVDSVGKSNDKVQELLDKSGEILSGADADVSKLETYKETLLEVAEAGEANEVQRFAISQIVGELGQEIPELAAAWDEETGSLNASTDAINAWFDAYEKSMMRTALIDAQKTAWEALTQAQINKAKADQAVKTSTEALTEAGKDEKSILNDGLTAVQEHNAAMYDLTQTRQEALETQIEAGKQMDAAKTEYENTSAAIKELADEMGISVDELRGMGNAEQEAADDTEELAAAVETVDPDVLEELTKAAEQMEESIDSAMENAVSAFDKFNAGTEISAEEIIENLDSQIDGLSNWADNMEKLGAQAGDGMSQELYDYLAEMGPESANLVQTLVESLEANDGTFEEISTKWGEALKLSDSSEMISSYTSAAKELSTAMGEEGTAAGDELSKGVESTKNKANKAGAAVGDESVKGAKSKKKAMNAAGTEGGQEYATGVSNKKGAARSAGSSLGESAKSGAGSVSAYSKGVDFGEGYVRGIRSKIPDARKAGQDLAKAGNDGIESKGGQDSNSPSRLTKKTGKDFTQGYINGIVSKNKELRAGVQKMVKGALSYLAAETLSGVGDVGAIAVEKLSDKIADKTEYAVNRMTYENNARVADFDSTIAKIEKESERKSSKLQAASDKKQKALQDKYDKEKDSKKKKAIKKDIQAEKDRVKKQIKESEKAYEKLIANQEKMKDQYQEASSAMISEYSKAMSAYQKAAEELIDSAVSGVTDQYEEKYNALMDAQEGLIHRMMDARELFTVSSAGVLRIGDLNEQTKEITTYTNRLKAIKSKVSADLFDEISRFDMREGNAYMEHLLSMSTKELSAYNAAYTKKVQTAQKGAESLYKGDFDRVAKEYQTEMEKALKGLPAALNVLGQDTMKGFIDGLTKNTDYMEKGVRTFVNGMIANFKKDLKIQSPSKVTYNLGEFTGEGFVDGLLSIVGELQAAVKEISGAVEFGDLSKEIRPAILPGTVGGSVNVVNNYNLNQTNNSPRPLTALETYQARRQQIDMIKAFTGV